MKISKIFICQLFFNLMVILFLEFFRKLSFFLNNFFRGMDDELSFIIIGLVSIGPNLFKKESNKYKS